MNLGIKLLIIFGISLKINVSECQRSDDVKSEWNSNKPCKSNLEGNIHGSVERDVTKNINGSTIRIAKRAVAVPDNVKIGFNGSFPFNLTRTKRQTIPSGPLPSGPLMGGTIGGTPPSNGMAAPNGMPAPNGLPLASTNVLSPSPAINPGVPAVFNQPAVATISNVAPVPSNTGLISSVAAPGPVVFPPS